MTKLIRKNVREIKIGDRIRKVITDEKKKTDTSSLRDLMESLKLRGQIQPIVLNGDELLAGFRRLSAAALLMTEGGSIGSSLPEGHTRRLAPGEILCVQYKDMTTKDKLAFEIDENVHRKQFTSAERALGYQRLKKLMEKAEGREVSTKEIAKAAKVSRAQVTMGLKVAEAVDQGKTHLLQSSSIVAAYNKLNTENKIEELKARAAATPGKAPSEPKKDPFKGHLHNGDGIAFLKTLEDESVDFVNFDPPWGIDIDSYDRWNLYEKVGDNDATISFDRIIKPMVPELYRVLKTDTYMVVWFGMQFYTVMSDLLMKAGFKVRPVPSIWYKVNKSGSQSDSSRIELNVYEPFFICEKGSPRLFKAAQKNVYPYPMPNKRIHFNQKDVDLQVDILERYTFGNMLCLDPTFGSGSFLRACQRLGRGMKGAEKNEKNYNKALEWLRSGVLPV